VVSSSTKSSSDLNENWCVDRSRCVMHDGMLYDPIQCQGQGHRSSEVLKIAVFQVYLLRQWELENDL